MSADATDNATDNATAVMTKHIEALIFDWAGTVVDFGCFAPTQIFVDSFKTAFDFELSLDEARKPMGLGKWHHIEALSKDDEVQRRWQAQFGRVMSTQDIDHIYETFIPLQKERIAAHSKLIPGFLAVLNECRTRGYKIGSTTGYPRQVMDRLAADAAKQGYVPDCLICADDLAAGGRPGPWMALDCVLQLKARSVRHCIKIDDTTPGIAEGVNAGMWTIGVALSGNLCGLTEDAFKALSQAQKNKLRAPAEKTLRDAGAHVVIDTVADLLPALAQIDQWIKSGQKP